MGKSSNKISPKTEKSASEKLMEVLVVVMLGLSAFMIAWVSWVAATHAGAQSLKFTTSNNLDG